MHRPQICLSICIPEQKWVQGEREAPGAHCWPSTHSSRGKTPPPSSHPECGQKVCGAQGKLGSPTPGPLRGCRLSHPRSLEELRARVPRGSLSPGAEVAGVWQICRVLKVTSSITSARAISKITQETRSSEARSSFLTGFQKTRGSWKCFQLCMYVCMSRCHVCPKNTT